MTSNVMDTRAKHKPPPPDQRHCRQQSQQSQLKPQSRIQAYIDGKLPLDQMVNKDRIIKPEERHNKRAFLPRINDDVKIVPRKAVKAKTIEVKVPSAVVAPSQPRAKTKIKEYDETTSTFRTPQRPTRPKKKQAFSIDLKDYHFVIKNKGSNNHTAAIEFKYQDKSSDDENTPNAIQFQSPFSPNPGNQIIPIISNVNHISPPDKTYYEETLGTKNDEISMLKEKVRNLQKNLIAKSNYFGAEEDNVINKIVKSLEIITNTVKGLKNTTDRNKISQYLATIEEQQEKWYSYIETISAAMQHLKESNLRLKNDNTIKEAQLKDEQDENERLQKELINLKTEHSNLLREKNHFVDSLDEIKYNLRITEKDNEYLRQQAEDHKRLNEKAVEQLDMLNEAFQKVQKELQDREKISIEKGAQLKEQITILEAANGDLTRKYEQVSNKVNILDELSRAESRHRNEIETAVAAKQQYIETLEKEAERLQDEVHSLKTNLQQVSCKNERNFLIISQLTNENHMLREDTKNMAYEREQLKEGIAEWCKNEFHDSVQLIDMIDKLKMKTIVAETNYSNRLMEDLDQTIKFTRFLDDPLDS